MCHWYRMFWGIRVGTVATIVALEGWYLGQNSHLRRWDGMVMCLTPSLAPLVWTLNCIWFSQGFFPVVRKTPGAYEGTRGFEGYLTIYLTLNRRV